MKISDLLDVIEDDTVSIREQEIIASERIMEVTMEKIRIDADASGTAKKRLSKGTIALLIAAAVLALSVTAYASGVFGRLVDWNGQTVETETDPIATMPPSAEMIENTERDAVINSILDQRGDRELVIVRDSGGGSSTDRTAPLASIEELADLLTKESSVFTVPITIPEGYTLVMGQVSFDSARGYGYTLESTETREDGLEVEHYSAPAEGDFISGYTLEWDNAAGQRISLRADMMQDAENMGFGVWGESKVANLTVVGMDDALVIEDGQISSIWLRQKLDPPVPYEDTLAVMAKDIPAGGAGDKPFSSYTDVIYQIYAQGQTAEEIQAMLIY